LYTGTTPTDVQKISYVPTFINTAVDFTKQNEYYNFKNLVLCGLRPTTNPPISVGGVILQVTERQRYLGLIFDSTMLGSTLTLYSTTLIMFLMCSKISIYFCLELIVMLLTIA